MHGAELLLPGDHALAEIIELHPKYSANAAALAAAIAAKYPGAALIDVGANVGDTVGIWRQVSDSPILAVEGDPQWQPYLAANTRELAAVEIAPIFVAAEARQHGHSIKRTAGTSTLAGGEGSGEFTFEPVSELIARHPRFAEPKLVKSDTDGFDYEIVRAFARSGIASRPVYFFEHDPSFRESGLAEAEELRSALVLAGYTRAVWWDNFGNLLACTALSDGELWSSLSRYVPAPSAAYYWDVAVFSEDDRDLALAVSSK